MSKFKIGIDIHGVLDTHTEYFKSICKSMSKQECCEVHIITGSPKNEISDWLENNGIKYDHFYSITDDLISKGYEHEYRRCFKTNTMKGPFFNKEVWNKAKSIYCDANDINIMYDDNIDYLKYMNPLKTLWIHVNDDFKYKLKPEGEIT